MKKAYIALVLALALVAGLSAQTINVLFWDDAYPRTLMERIPEFEKATGIKVNFEILPAAPSVHQDLGERDEGEDRLRSRLYR